MHLDSKRSFWDKFWEDKHGRLAVWQKPNVFLIVWFVSILVQILLGGGTISNFARTIGTISIAIWAVLEVVSGASYFRRILGISVLLFTIVLNI